MLKFFSIMSLSFIFTILRSYFSEPNIQIADIIEMNDVRSMNKN